MLRFQGTKVNARRVREFAAYDPRGALAKITVPVLAITGAQDMQVPAEDVRTRASWSPDRSTATSSRASATCSGPTRTASGRAATARPSTNRSAPRP
ncbi:MAG TPA: hypothetical protein VFW65_24860 [Pseudonocardiaceae bacterium]|nr:hypothetical protein [Pseudonocardiaceae bacterium]